MLRVGEHVDGLYATNIILGRQKTKVAGLRGGVATDVYNLSWRCRQQLGDNTFMHSGTRRVGDDHIRSAIRLDELGREHLSHIASIEHSIVEAVPLGIGTSVGIYQPRKAL